MQQQFEAFRSLEAYSQILSGFVTSVNGHIIAKFVVLAKVIHSHRMNDSLIPVWIVTAKEGTILSAYCSSCKAYKGRKSVDKYFESICVPFSVGISLSASPASKFKSKICCPGLVTLRNFFSLSDSSFFTLLANAKFFTYSRFFTLSLVFSACSRSVRPVFHLHSRQSRT